MHYKHSRWETKIGPIGESKGGDRTYKNEMSLAQDTSFQDGTQVITWIAIGLLRKQNGTPFFLKPFIGGNFYSKMSHLRD